MVGRRLCQPPARLAMFIFSDYFVARPFAMLIDALVNSASQRPRAAYSEKLIHALYGKVWLCVKIFRVLTKKLRFYELLLKSGVAMLIDALVNSASKRPRAAYSKKLTHAFYGKVWLCVRTFRVLPQKLLF